MCRTNGFSFFFLKKKSIAQTKQCIVFWQCNQAGPAGLSLRFSKFSYGDRRVAAKHSQLLWHWVRQRGRCIHLLIHFQGRALHSVQGDFVFFFFSYVNCAGKVGFASKIGLRTQA